MAWETRGGDSSRRYYYTAQKVNGRVEKRYIGSGSLAESIARLEAIDRGQAEEEATARREGEARLDVLDAALAAFCEAVDAQMREVLTGAGYHRHDRGNWRRKRRTNGN